MNEQNKQFLSDNYNLKEQAEAGTLVLSEEQKREFYRVLHEEVSGSMIINLYSQEDVIRMVKACFIQLRLNELLSGEANPEEPTTLKTSERKTTVNREEVTKAVKGKKKK